MKTKKMLETATAENAAEAIRVAITPKPEGRGWTPAAVLKHGNAAIQAQLGVAKANTVLAPARGKKVKKVVKLDTSKARAVSLTADLTSYRGGATVRELITGQRNVIGARGAKFALLKTESGESFRISEPAFARLVESKKTILAFIGGRGVNITLA
jgi:hypothetical protein